jgi:hypothetical protein
MNHLKTINLNLACKGITVLAILLGLVNIVVSNQLSTQGQALANTNKKITVLEKEAFTLNEEIAAKNALAQVDSSAVKFGFVAINSPLALNGENRVALVP